MRPAMLRHAMMRSVLGVAALATLTVLVPAEARAQEDVSIYTLVDAQGGRLVLGEPSQGTLTAADPVSEVGRRVQVWLLALDAGDDVQLDMSGGFDTFLQLVGPGLGQGLTDDDGGNGLNSRLCFTAATTGEYRVVAASLGSATGTFELAARLNPGGSCGAATGEVEIDDLAQVPVADRVLQVGTPVEGILGDQDPLFYGSRVQGWAVAGRAGESFSVDLVSDDFDAYLTVLGPGLEEWLTDDDGAGACDSRVSLTFPETGDYHVVVGTLANGTGSFSLIPSREPGPVSGETCSPRYADGVEEVDEGSLDDIAVVGGVSVPGGASGTMNGGEATFRGHPLQGWDLEGTADQRLALTLSSDAFDAYLAFQGPGFPDPLTDDDSGGGLNSRICVDLPERGTYRVYTGALSSAQAGSRYELEVVAGAEADALCEGQFTLSPARVAEAVLRMDTQGRLVGVGEAVEGSLDTDGAVHPSTGLPVQPWLLRGTPGATVWVDVVSYEFDTTVEVVWSGLAQRLFNDDSGDGCASRLEFTLPASGEALVLPGAWSQGSGGTFLLRVSGEEPGPIEAGSCGGEYSDEGGDFGPTGTLVDRDLLDGVTASPDNVLEVGLDIFAYIDEGGEITVDGKAAQAWWFDGAEGDDLTFEVISDDFDPVLWIGGPGLDGVLYDDDSAGSLDSRVEVVLPASGRFTVVVGAWDDTAGFFRIRVLRRAGD